MIPSSETVEDHASIYTVFLRCCLAFRLLAINSNVMHCQCFPAKTWMWTKFAIFQCSVYESLTYSAHKFVIDTHKKRHTDRLISVKSIVKSPLGIVKRLNKKSKIFTNAVLFPLNIEKGTRLLFREQVINSFLLKRVSVVIIYKWFLFIY